MASGEKTIDIAITGANGAVGKALLERLGADSPLAHARVRALVRDIARGESLRSTHAEIIEVNYADPKSLAGALNGVDRVAHLAGSLVPRAGDSLVQANLLTTKNVVEASRAGGARSFVYLSFPDADPKSKNTYLQTKGQAEEVIRKNFPCGAILRVPMILGPDAPAINQMKKMLRSAVIPLVGGGAVCVQPIYEGDVLCAIEWALLHPDTPLRTMNLTGPDTLPYSELLRRAGGQLGKRPRILTIPRGLGRAVSTFLGWLSPPSSPLGRAAFDVVFYEHLHDDEARSVMSIPRTGIEEALRLSLPHHG